MHTASYSYFTHLVLDTLAVSKIIGTPALAEPSESVPNIFGTREIPNLL